MKFTLKIPMTAFYERVGQGARASRFHGRAYCDFRTMESVMVLVPFHHLVALMWRLNHWYRKYQGSPSWIDRYVEDLVMKCAVLKCGWNCESTEVERLRQKLRNIEAQ